MQNFSEAQRGQPSLQDLVVDFEHFLDGEEEWVE